MLLKRAYARMEKTVEQQWAQRDVALPYKTPQQLVTMASIIEKETGLGEERPKVASVFINRLRIGMRLQTDPTVIYGLGNAYNGNLTRRDLQQPTPITPMSSPVCRRRPSPCRARPRWSPRRTRPRRPISTSWRMVRAGMYLALTCKVIIRRCAPICRH